MTEQSENSSKLTPLRWIPTDHNALRIPEGSPASDLQWLLPDMARGRYVRLSVIHKELLQAQRAHREQGNVLAVVYMAGETALAGFMDPGEAARDPLLHYYPAAWLINHDLTVTRPMQEAHIAIAMANPENGEVAEVISTGLITWTDHIPDGLRCVQLPEGLITPQDLNPGLL